MEGMRDGSERSLRKAAKEHPESLAKLLLVKHLLTDPLARLQPRAIDVAWHREKAIDSSVVGFNPFSGKVFYASESAFARWLKEPQASARKHNAFDQLIPEVLAAVHDYMHIWALNAMIEVLPRGAGFGSASITEKNFEDFVFCHLVAEVAASVGTDYWFLSTLDINKECDLGSCFQKRGYQTTYHESDLLEFRRFCPDLVVQDPSFFEYFADAYVQGHILGFDSSAVMRSPKVYAWLNHEVTYGETARKWTRLWFSNYSEGRVSLNKQKIGDPIAIDKRWKKDVIQDMASLLWEKCKKGKIHRFGKTFNPERAWKTTRKAAPDFRFTNLNRLREQDLKPELFPKSDPMEFKMFFHQLASKHLSSEFDIELLRLFKNIIATQDMKLALSVFRHQPKVKPCSNEPYDLFLLP